MISIKLKRLLRGIYKSWSMHFSTLAIILGGLEQYSGTLTAFVGSKNAGAVIMVGGIVGMILRAKTSQSLTEKGSK